MLTRLLDWVAGKEPVASATGIAAVVTAGLGVGAAFGLDITAEQIAAIGALAAALAGWAARRQVTPVEAPEARRAARTLKTLDPETGSVPLALLILVALGVVLLAGLGVCTDALFEDEDETNDLGVAVTQLAYHEEDCNEYGCDSNYSQDYSSRDRNRNRGRDRGAFSPGPFEDSPVDFRDNCISLDCGGRERDQEEPPS